LKEGDHLATIVQQLLSFRLFTFSPAVILGVLCTVLL
jgi:hypothetical protein